MFSLHGFGALDDLASLREDRKPDVAPGNESAAAVSGIFAPTSAWMISRPSRNSAKCGDIREARGL
jgi:hypothetical protein